MGKSTISMAMFNSYVSLPEGTLKIDMLRILRFWVYRIGQLLQPHHKLQEPLNRESSNWGTPGAIKDVQQANRFTPNLGLKQHCSKLLA